MPAWERLEGRWYEAHGLFDVGIRRVCGRSLLLVRSCLLQCEQPNERKRGSERTDTHGEVLPWEVSSSYSTTRLGAATRIAASSACSAWHAVGAPPWRRDLRRSWSVGRAPVPRLATRRRAPILVVHGQFQSRRLVRARDDESRNRFGSFGQMTEDHIGQPDGRRQVRGRRSGRERLLSKATAPRAASTRGAC